MKTLLGNEYRDMAMEDLVKAAGGRKKSQLKDDELFNYQELFNFETFINSLPDRKRHEALALVELYKRSLNSVERRIIKESCDIYYAMRDVLTGLKEEEFWVLTLDQSLRVISRRRISRGGIDHTGVDIRTLLKGALMDNATVIVAVHNHPSGQVMPSNADKLLTNSIQKAAETLKIRFFDHVIFADDIYYSFHDQGLL